MSPIAVQPTFAELQAEAIDARDATISSAYKLPKSLYPLPKNVSTTLQDAKILDATELSIVDLAASELRDAIAAKKYTAVQVTKAYCKAAAIAQQVTNCLTELFEAEALERAQWLDDELQRTGKVVGPFHGVPASIKDHIDIKGHDSASGFLSLRGRLIAAEDAHLVSILRDAGAIFYAKTTNPQSLMHLETSCYLGATVNPFNTDLTAGGSSGGEGAMIGMKASCFGIGTDIGGSIRSPAAANGIYGFKPTALRMPAGGLQMPVGPMGYEGILCTHGPMGRSIEDLEMYMKLVAAAKPWRKDPVLHVKPWVASELSQPDRKIRIGIMKTDGVVTPVAPIQRALAAAAQKLGQSPDFEVVDYAPIMGREAWEIISKLYWPDKGKVVFDHIAKSGEPVLPLTQWIIDHTKDATGTLEESLALVERRDQFRAAVSAHWHELGIDVLLTPVGPTPAPKLETAKYWNYTSYWNLANYPAAVFPTGLLVDPSVDSAAYAATNADEEWIKQTFSAEGSVGAPLSLQLVGYVGHDEDTLAAAKRVVKCLLA